MISLASLRNDFDLVFSLCRVGLLIKMFFVRIQLPTQSKAINLILISIMILAFRNYENMITKAEP